MTSLAAGLDAPPSGRARAVWFDAYPYCCARLGGGAAVPWTAPGDLVALASKAQSMFASDALLVDLDDLYGQQVITRDDLRGAMGARTRPGFALRTLLADERCREVAVAAAGALASSSRGTPVILRLPSPARWVAVAAAAASNGAGAEPISPDVAEAGAMYVADLLRVFGGVALAGLLLDEGATPKAELVTVEAYRAVLNVAEHFGWPVLVRTDGAECWPAGPHPGVAAWIGTSAPSALNAERWGIVVPGAAWLAGHGLPAVSGGPAIVVIPADADPVVVMQRVRELG